MENIQDILSGINIPIPAQKIYLALLEKGKATARTLSLRTGITRTSVYDQIKILRSKDLIAERFEDGKSFFEVGDVRRLSTLLEDQADKLKAQQEFLNKNISSLIDKSQSAQPKVRFFEGEEGAKQLVKDILWYDEITLYLYWPYEKMLELFGQDFLTWFSKRREFHGISIKTIWGNAPSKGKKHIFANDGGDVERRYLKQKNIPSMGFMLFDKKVAFISSQKESFGFIVESVEFSALQKMQFDILWEKAKK